MDVYKEFLYKLTDFILVNMKTIINTKKNLLISYNTILLHETFFISILN